MVNLDDHRAAVTDHDGIWVHVRSYDVTIWPPHIECADSETWKITVEYRGQDTWAVKRGPFCLGSDGTWVPEPIPSYRRDGWLKTHRFPLDQALDLACQHAPKIVINGMTALEVFARHQAHHPDGNCDPH